MEALRTSSKDGDRDSVYSGPPCGEYLGPHNSGQVIYYDPSHDVRPPQLYSAPTTSSLSEARSPGDKEYRFWFDDDELLQRINAGEEFREEDLSPGRPVGIRDMQRLIKTIVVAPGATDEFIEQLRAACREHQKHGSVTSSRSRASDRMWDSFTR